MKAYYLNVNDVYVDIVRSDNLRYLKTLKSNSVHSVVCDPPYEIAFMGKKWDKDSNAHDKQLWKECLRVLKPGGYLLAFAATRTYHRLATAIEDARFTIKDQICWVYGSGFPKGQNIEKAINKLDGVKFKSKPAKGVGFMKANSKDWNPTKNQLIQIGKSSKIAKQWEGWNTALKPALEPIVMAQKPISEKTIVANVLKHGTGALNIDGCRIAMSDKDKEAIKNMTGFGTKGYTRKKNKETFMRGTLTATQAVFDKGRWPANLIHNGHEEVLSLFPHTKSGAISAKMKRTKGNQIYGLGLSKVGNPITLEDKAASEGSAARFFYQAKANKSERNNSKHPTVKPIKLMRYLVRLVTPPNGVVLDPFSGTGTTGMAAYLEGFDSIMIEQSKEYVEDIKNRFRPHMR